MNLQDCYIEEDLFPKIFTKAEERDYGILFYNTENKDSFDSNHAVIYRERIQNLQAVTEAGLKIRSLCFLKKRMRLFPTPDRNP